jgi:hypothetical protein
MQEIASAQHRAALRVRRVNRSHNDSMSVDEDEDEEDDEGEPWDAPLQRLRVFPVAHAEALLWVRN